MAKKRTLQGALKAAVQQQKQHQKHQQKRNASALSSSSHGPPSKKQKLNANPSQQKQQPQKKKHVQPSQLRPVIPFSPSEHILLIGEADLSFAASLATHHKCVNLTATVLEPSLAALQEKYPHVSDNVSSLLSTPTNSLLYGVDARKLSSSPPSSSSSSSSSSAATTTPKAKLKPHYDRIIFNFPHVGGKSTDVNRQVRYNQEMLVDFFRCAKLLLGPERGSSIVVTLFEGEPYTLWNIKDLARHSGLEVARSFVFGGAEVYPGYRHARTLGVVRRKKDGMESKTAWKGEERRARSFVFVRKGEGQVIGKGKGKKNNNNTGDSESEDEESEGWEGFGEGDEGEDEEGGEDEVGSAAEDDDEEAKEAEGKLEDETKNEEKEEDGDQA